MKHLEPLFEKIKAICDDHTIEAEPEGKIKEAISDHFEACASERLNSAIDSSNAKLQGVIDQISDALANSKIPEATQLAVANASRDPVKPEAEEEEKSAA